MCGPERDPKSEKQDNGRTVGEFTDRVYTSLAGSGDVAVGTPMGDIRIRQNPGGLERPGNYRNSQKYRKIMKNLKNLEISKFVEFFVCF